MGIEITRQQFEPAEYQAFAVRLRESLRALERVLARPGFGEGPTSIGAELELNLVDGHGRPARVNEAVLASAGEPRLDLELNRFNMEINSTPALLQGTPFSTIGGEFREVLTRAQQAARQHGARVVPIGILPTLTTFDVLADVMTDRLRYRALSKALRDSRGGPFRIRINGLDPIDLGCDDVTLEGAATSFQLHLRVNPNRFADFYNAAQIATPLALAVSANSPFFLGHRLWDETRIALFKQAVDDRRGERSIPGWPSPRVSFGHGWVRDGIHELFAEAVSLHTPLLPVLSDESPMAAIAAGDTPALDELRLHCGTIWRWNRAIYDPHDDGHVRIEMRALPAGPTVVDMMANSAFLIGLTFGLADHVEQLVAQLPFAHARHNFYRAAQDGLDATLLWPADSAPSPRPETVTSLVTRLLPVAHQGLVEAGVAVEEADDLLSVIRARCDTNTTGASWQRHAHIVLEARVGSRAEAMHRLVDAYEANVVTGQPVHLWPLPR